MIRIKGRKISITRGDCRPFTITLHLATDSIREEVNRNARNHEL
jgi:hypothetical protein